MPDNSYKKSYVIPGRDVPAMDAKFIRDSLAIALISLLKNDGKIIDFSSGVVRSGLANADFAVGNATAQNWVTPALTANTVATYINNALVNNKYAGFYGVCSIANPACASLRFAVGSTGGATRGRYQLQQLYAELQSVGYFPDPIIYAPTETVFVEVVPTATVAAGEALPMLVLIAEPKGPFVS